MSIPSPQDPAPWAAKLRELTNATPSRPLSVVIVPGRTVPVTRPEGLEITGDGSRAVVLGPNGPRYVLALDWVVDVVVSGEAAPPPRPPRYAAKLRALQKEGPFGPLVLTLRDGRQFPLAGPQEFLVATDGRSVAVCDRDGGLVVLATAEITDLAPGASLSQGGG